MKKLFFELMQIAVGQLDCLSRGPSPEEWQELYALTQREAVSAICYSSVVALFEFGLRAPQDLALDWMAEAEELKERNRGTAKRLQALQQLLEEQSVRSSLVAGAGQARFYGKTLQALRQSDGTDLYVIGDTQKVDLSEWADMNVKLCKTFKVGNSSMRNRRLERWMLQNDELLFRKAGELTIPTYAVAVVLQLAFIYNQYVSKRMCLPCSSATSPTLTIGKVSASPKPITVYLNNGCCGCCQSTKPCTNQIAITTSINVATGA